MAIIIEEEKNRSGLFRMIGWLVAFCIVAASIYYIFFAAPQLAIIEPSGNLTAIAPILDNHIDPNQILQSPAFQALKPSPVPEVPTSTGTTGGARTNPFIAP